MDGVRDSGARGAPLNVLNKVNARRRIVQTLQQALPELMAVYGFGSRIQGTATPDSDWDVAVLVPGRVEPVKLWTLAQDLADIVGSPVDLVDLRAASTILQYQVITTGERWWARDSGADLYETVILSEKTALDEARAGLLRDILREGRVYGRRCRDQQGCQH
jgi:predicted nucleotidyltransferase